MFEIDERADFSSGNAIRIPGVQHVSSLQYISSNSVSLQYGTHYFWRAKVFNQNDSSMWSEVWSFTTNYQLNQAPTLISPTNTAQMVPSNGQAFQWTASNGANSYQIEIATDSLFTNPIRRSTTALQTTFNGLLVNQQYYWRVRGSDSFGNSPWSNIWSFNTLLSTNLNDLSIQEFQVYPNPSNGYICIELNRKQDQFTVVQSNVHGQLIKSQTFEGTSKVNYSLKGKAGIYFVEIFSQNQLIDKLKVIKQ